MYVNEDKNYSPTASSDVAESNTKIKAPMTKEEWEKQQSVLRRVYDPDTGRTRFVILSW